MKCISLFKTQCHTTLPSILLSSLLFSITTLSNIALANNLPNHNTGNLPVLYAELLPSHQQVLSSLQQHPLVLATANDIAYQQAYAQKLTVGEPWQVSLGLQHRNNKETQQQSLEPNIRIDKQIRWPSNFQLDQQLGASAKQLANINSEATWHDAAIKLLENWYNYLTLLQRIHRQQELIQLIDNQLNVIDSRIKAGDAAKLERMLIESEKKTAVIYLGTLTTEREIAKTNLSQYYQGDIPRNIMALNQIDQRTIAELQGQIQQFSINDVLTVQHELMMAKQKADMAKISQQRAQNMKRPDPVIGIGSSLEQQANERLLSISISVPFGQKALSASANMAAAEAETALSNAVWLEKSLQQHYTTQLISLKQASQQVILYAQAKSQLSQQSQLMNKAYRYGEVSINDWLLSLKQLNEANINLDKSQLDLLFGYHQWFIDSHQMWQKPD